MYLSLNWIKDFVDLSGINPHDLGYNLTMSTAEVDSVEMVGKDINNVVIGKIVKMEPHPSSAKLKIVQVDIGNETVQSVCGAPNVQEGILVPFAKIGGSIKKIDRVAKTMVSGIESNGICCSASEIGISDDHSGLLVLDDNYKTGTDIKEVIDIDDVIIEIDNKAITNRPDLWGHYGFARELAAIYKRELKPLLIDELKGSENLPKIDVEVLDKDKCFRYSCITIDNINKKVSPISMQTRLFYCGMRPISLMVDLTNYLMLEIGQPMHAFDKKFMPKVIVKSTDTVTKFKTLDSVEREIPKDTLMICNHEIPVGIAGIMGGENSEIAEDTTSILLESANFEGSSTRKNASKIGIRTEASARFEKMLDPEMTVTAIKRFVKLLKDVDTGIAVSSSLSDVYAKKYDIVSITVEKALIDKYMGQSLSKDRIVEILKALEFKVAVDGDIFHVDVPTFRATKDVTIKADIIEEVTRIYGYNNIEPQPIKAELEPLNYNEARIIDHKVKEIFAENYGFSEVHSHVWYDNKVNTRLGVGERDGLKIINSCDGNNGVLRDSLAPIMINFAAENKKNYDEFGIFEIGGVFTIENKESLCEEHKNLCLLIASKSESEDELFYKAKGILTSLLKAIKKIDLEYAKANKILEYTWVHPIKAAEVSYKGDNFGYISVVHPKVKENVDKKLNMVIIEINMFRVHDLEEKQISYQEPSKYPQVTMDLSLLIDKNIMFERINSELSDFEHDLLIEHKFIDIYSGKGIPDDKKSMTFNFRIGSKEHTLSSEEIEQFRESLIGYVQSKGYSLR